MSARALSALIATWMGRVRMRTGRDGEMGRWEVILTSLFLRYLLSSGVLSTFSNHFKEWKSKGVSLIWEFPENGCLFLIGSCVDTLFEKMNRKQTPHMADPYVFVKQSSTQVLSCEPAKSASLSGIAESGARQNLQG